MPRMIQALLALLLALHPAAALPQSNFDDLPNLGDSSGAIFSPQQDRALGAFFMRQIRQSGIILEDEEATAYLVSLGRRLTKHSENPGYDFTFFLVNDPSINAFAGPGGYIGAHVGLFLSAESESELAGVMAHEIAHVTQRHLARAFDNQEKMSVPTMAAILAAVLLGATTDGSAGAAALMAAQAASLQNQINFTRANEKEADRVGIQTLADAGYDPFGMPMFFEKLQKNSKLYGTRPPEFLSTHPVTLNRISEATTRAESYPPVKPRDEMDFMLVKTKLRVNSYKNPKQVLADVQRYEGKQGGASPVKQYEFGLLLLRTENHAAAQNVMEKLHRSDPDRIAYRLAWARTLNADKHYDRALAIYTDTLELYPGEMTVVLPYAETLMAAGQNVEAFDLLNDMANRNSSNPKLHKLLAQAASATGHPVRTHTAMSQYYFLNGYTNQAIEQLKLAEKSPELTSYQIARIQARIADLEALLELEELE